MYVVLGLLSCLVCLHFVFIIVIYVWLILDIDPYSMFSLTTLLPVSFCTFVYDLSVSTPCLFDHVYCLARNKPLVSTSLHLGPHFLHSISPFLTEIHSLTLPPPPGRHPAGWHQPGSRQQDGSLGESVRFNVLTSGAVSKRSQNEQPHSPMNSFLSVMVRRQETKAQGCSLLSGAHWESRTPIPVSEASPQDPAWWVQVWTRSVIWVP